MRNLVGLLSTICVVSIIPGLTKAKVCLLLIIMDVALDHHLKDVKSISKIMKVKCTPEQEAR